MGKNTYEKNGEQRVFSDTFRQPTDQDCAGIRTSVFMSQKSKRKRDSQNNSKTGLTPEEKKNKDEHDEGHEIEMNKSGIGKLAELTVKEPIELRIYETKTEKKLVKPEIWDKIKAALDERVIDYLIENGDDISFERIGYNGAGFGFVRCYEDQVETVKTLVNDLEVDNKNFRAWASGEKEGEPTIQFVVKAALFKRYGENIQEIFARQNDLHDVKLADKKPLDRGDVVVTFKVGQRSIAKAKELAGRTPRQVKFGAGNQAAVFKRI